MDWKARFETQSFKEGDNFYLMKQAYSTGQKVTVDGGALLI